VVKVKVKKSQEISAGYKINSSAGAFEQHVNVVNFCKVAGQESPDFKCFNKGFT
jgi:hypothetical protein